MKNNANILQPIRYKSIVSGLKMIDEEKRRVSFYAAHFGNIDSDNEIIVPGAFAKSIREHGPDSGSPQKIAYLYQHKIDKPIGGIVLMKEDSVGLYCEAILDDIALANDVKTQYESGTLNQHSIGFRYIWDKMEYDEDLEALVLKEVRLMEVSVVTIGANENTPFVGFKSDQIEDEKTKHAKAIEVFLKTLDSTISHQIRQYISKSVALAITEPLKDTQNEPQEDDIDWDKIKSKLKN